MNEIERDDELGWLEKTLDRVIDAQRPLVVNHLRSLRRKHPDLSPEQVIKRIEKQYLTAVTAGGAAVGATAVAPGIGTVTALGLTAAETVVFLEASAFFAQAVTEIHGIHLDDPDRSKALVMSLMLGHGGKELVRRVAAQSMGRGAMGSQYWGQLITSRLPSGMMGQVLDFLRRAFVRRLARNTGASAVGRMMPFGIGAVIGGVGNNILGRQVVRAARDAFGPAPVSFHSGLAPLIKEVPEPKEKRTLAERFGSARRIEREGLGGGLRRARGRHAEPSDATDAPPSNDTPPTNG